MGGGGGGGGKQGALCENGESQFIPPVRHFCIKHCLSGCYSGAFVRAAEHHW